MKFKLGLERNCSVIVRYLKPITLANLHVIDQQGRFSPKYNLEAEVLAVGVDVKDYKKGDKVIVQNWALTNAFEYEGSTYSRTHEDNVLCTVEHVV